MTIGGMYVAGYLRKMAECGMKKQAFRLPRGLLRGVSDALSWGAREPYRLSSAAARAGRAASRSPKLNITVSDIQEAMRRAAPKGSPLAGAIPRPVLASAGPTLAAGTLPPAPAAQASGGSAWRRAALGASAATAVGGAGYAGGRAGANAVIDAQGKPAEVPAAAIPAVAPAQAPAAPVAPSQDKPVTSGGGSGIGKALSDIANRVKNTDVGTAALYAAGAGAAGYGIYQLVQDIRERNAGRKSKKR